jgi:hypothetical protein
MTSTSCQHFVSTNAVVWAEPQPGGEVRLGFPSTHIQSHLTYDCLGDHRIDTVDARQIHSGNALQFVGEMEVWIILVLFLLLFRG